MDKNNYYSVSGTYGDEPKTIKAGFRSGYDIDSAIEKSDHFFDVSDSFPELAEYSRVDSGLALGLSPDALSFTEDAVATIKMVQSAGIFKNVLGYYTTDSDGTIRDVSIAFNNTRSAESGVTHSFDVGGARGSVNFFLISNGYNLNRIFSKQNFEDGHLSFVYNQGGDDERPAQITDNADDITLVYQAGNGEITTVRGPVYHATEQGSQNNINGDGNTHVVSGLTSDGDNQVIRVGFEDFPGLGDADFNDVVFDVSASYLDPSYAGLDATLLSSIEPAAPGEAAQQEGLSDVDFDHGSADTLTDKGDGKGTMSDPKGSGSNPDGGFSDAENFIVYLAEQMNSLLPDLYNQVKQEIYDQYGDAMYDNYERIFADYVQENYEHIYNEIKAGYYDRDFGDGLVVAPPELSPGSPGDFSVSYDEMIETIDHIDESISNFIHLNTIDNSIDAPVSSSPSVVNQPHGHSATLQEGFDPVIEAEIII